MTEAELIEQINHLGAGVDILSADGDYYIYYYDPDSTEPKDRRFPWATVVTGDRHDTVSQLDRPGIYRLNIGVSKERFQQLFPTAKATAAEHDFAALDRLLPHPVYGSMYWLCVLNPGEATWPVVRQLLAEAYQSAVQRHKIPS